MPYDRYNALWDQIWESERRSAKDEGRPASMSAAAGMLSSIVGNLVGPYGTTMPENVERNLKFGEQLDVGGEMPGSARGLDLAYGARGKGTVTVPSRWAPSRTQMAVWGVGPYGGAKTRDGYTTFYSGPAGDEMRRKYRGTDNLADRIRRRRGGY